MRPEETDWPKLKEEKPLAWHNRLVLRTLEALKSDGFELSSGNDLGYFHHVPDESHFRQMQKEWERKKRVPEEWISKGSYAGIWTSLFSPHNTYSSWPPPRPMIRFYFKEGFFIYDKENKEHQKMRRKWKDGSRKNPWALLKNDRGSSLEKRMKELGCPGHKCFYEDNRFGAIIGYLDYISPVIVLEDAVERVEFLTV